MDVENAAGILAGTILVGLSLIIAVAVIVIINNIISKYWKPVNLAYFVPKSAFEPGPRFMTEEPKEPKFTHEEVVK